MEFSYPGTSLFSPEGREVVAWSVEEFGSLKMKGYTETRPVAVVVPIAEAKHKAKPAKAPVVGPEAA